MRGFWRPWSWSCQARSELAERSELGVVGFDVRGWLLSGWLAGLVALLLLDVCFRRVASFEFLPFLARTLCQILVLREWKRSGPSFGKSFSGGMS